MVLGHIQTVLSPGWTRMNRESGGLKYAAVIGGVDKETYKHMCKWCRELYGPPSLRGLWCNLDYSFQFKRIEDRDWFLLKWT